MDIISHYFLSPSRLWLEGKRRREVAPEKKGKMFLVARTSSTPSTRVPVTGTYCCSLQEGTCIESTDSSIAKGVKVET